MGSRQLIVELIGETRSFTKGMGDAEKAAGSFGSVIGDAGKKMTSFVSVPIIGFLGVATKAAMDDAAAQSHLATELKNATGATFDQIGKVEDWVTKAMGMSTFSDDELRPSFETLVRSTNDATKAMDLQAIAMNVAASKGIPLETATLAVAKASEGQFAAVNKLVPGLVDLSDKTLTVDQVTAKLAETFSGSAQAATETVAGKAAMASRDFGELTEKIGGQLLPVAAELAGFLTESLIPTLDGLSGDNGALILLGVAAAGPVATGVGSLTKVVGGLNSALLVLNANPALLTLAALAVSLPSIKKDVESVAKTTSEKGFLAGVEESIFGSLHGRAWRTRETWEWFKDQIPGFASGGTVPGPPGAPRLIMAHGGEEVLTARQAAGGGGPVVVQLVVDGRTLAEVVATNQRANTRRGFAAS